MISTKIDSIQTVIQEGTININSPKAIIKNLSSLAQKKKTRLVLLNANPVTSAEQILFALEQALNAVKNKTAYSKKIELELMMRLSGTTKIKKALELLELKKGLNRVVLVGFGKKDVKKTVMQAIKATGLKEKNGLLEAGLKKKSKKRVEEERKAALERVALTGLV